MLLLFHKYNKDTQIASIDPFHTFFYWELLVHLQIKNSNLIAEQNLYETHNFVYVIVFGENYLFLYENGTWNIAVISFKRYNAPM